MDSSNTIKEFFENQGGIKMELNTISGLAIAGVICSVVLSMGVPIALFIAGRVKLKARISSFFIGAGTYLLFAVFLFVKSRFLGLSSFHPDKRISANLWLLHISEFPSHVLSGTFLCTLHLKIGNKLPYLHSTVRYNGSDR